jgi:hypothetical protein
MFESCRAHHRINNLPLISASSGNQKVSSIYLLSNCLKSITCPDSFHPFSDLCSIVFKMIASFSFDYATKHRRLRVRPSSRNKAQASAETRSAAASTRTA